MCLRLASSLLLACCAVTSAEPAAAPAPANQLVVAGNACGPTALLNAFRFGNAAWQRASDAIPGDSDRQRISNIIRQRGMQPSSHFPGRPRWSRKGVNLSDLRDIGDEMTRGRFLPQLSQEILIAIPGESQEKLLKRTHRRLATSLAKGLPPVVSLRRYARRSQDGQPPAWVVISAHFVTVTVVPAKLDRIARSFPVTYIDPWGGKIRQGAIAIPDRALLADSAVASPCLEAVFPDASVGKPLVRPGEVTAIAVAAALGRW